MDAVHIVGAGGIGCTVGYALASAGVPVVFVESNPRKVEVARRRRDPVRVEDRFGKPLGTAAAEFVHWPDWRPQPGTRVFLCTKCYHNAQVLERLDPSIRVLPIQNGFDPRLDSHGHEFEGIASFVAECLPGESVVRLTRKGALHLGRRDSGPTADSELQQLAAALRSAHLFRVQLVPRIEPIKYAKLMYNAAISPLAAAAGIDNGRLLSVPAARRLFFGLLQENYRILSSNGITLGKVGPFHPRTVAWILRQRWLARLMARGFEPSLRGTYCSMAGEIEKGRTEIENYNGHLIRLAEKSGAPCPLNRAVHSLVVRMTEARESPRMDVLRELAQ